LSKDLEQSGFLSQLQRRLNGAKNVFNTDVSQMKLERAKSFVGCETSLCNSSAQPEDEAI
jgi:threonine dehydrogenase-like Zn-dependent dehydrogenase